MATRSDMIWKRGVRFGLNYKLGNKRDIMSKVHFTYLGASAVAVVTLAATAAADGPRSIKDDQYDRPLVWSGAYAGAHLGGRWGDYGVNFEDAGNTISLHPQGIIGGLQVGYNVLASGVALGVEADVSFGSSRASFTDAWTVAARVELGTQGTLTARLGLPVGQFMPYVKGGLAWTRISVYGDSLQDGAPSGGREETQAAETLLGWTIGGGLEYALHGNWTARAEYLFTEFRRFTSTDLEGRSFRHDLDTHSLRLGLNYKLGN
jgi:outer membrane immunogenic protein